MTEAEWLTQRAIVWVLATSRLDGTSTGKRDCSCFVPCCRRRLASPRHPLLDEGIEALTAHYADPTGPDRPFGEGDERTLYTRIHEYTRNDGFPTQDCAESSSSSER